MTLRALLCYELPPVPEIRFEMKDGKGRSFTRDDNGDEIEGPSFLYFTSAQSKAIERAQKKSYQELLKDDQAAKDIKPWYQRAVDYLF